MKMGSLVRSFRDVIKKLAYSTSVDQLKKKGVHKVNVLGVDQIAFLIQEAVKRSLRFKLLALDREDVASATKNEFMRLLKSNEELERRRDELVELKEQAESQVDDLRRELTVQEKILAAKLDLAESDARVRYHGEDQEIVERLGLLVSGLSQAGDNSELRDRILDLVMDIVRDQRREAISAREAMRDREVDILQRRIRKLNDSLQQTEHRLSEFTAIRNLDEGISSVYREVQGLQTADDDEYRCKFGLMTSIFEANRRLQKRV